jgi:predicted ABC-type ATPase
MYPQLDKRPVIVAITGPNGAGKSTFYASFLRDCGQRFVNADDIARDLEIDAYAAAKMADSLRRELLGQRESFVFETVFSDPVGDKVAFLKEAGEAGYSVVLCFVGISSPEISETRVSMRVSQGGHDVPSDKLAGRYPRTLENLRRAIDELPLVLVFDNDDLAYPYRRVAEFANGKPMLLADPLPAWLKGIL